MTGTYRENMSFEAEVRRVAEAVWNMAPGQCQPTHYPTDPVVRELDGIARLRDVTHLLMATTSTRLDKVKDDVKKLQAAENIERSRAQAVAKWLITENQLDAQHIDYARKSNVTALTLAQFKRRFFDSWRYLSLRNTCAFGSARDPYTDSVSIADSSFVALPMRLSIDSRQGPAFASPRQISLEQVAQRVLEGGIVVLRAPFGSGKSVTTRELFKRLERAHRDNPLAPVPLALNLREHWGEDHSDEMLERHARSISYSPREDVVAAWRAGMCCVLLDGFDEVAGQSVARKDNQNFMRDARKRALQGVRDFTQKLPRDVGVFICGRDHYFDTDLELASSLGILGKHYVVVDLEEFTEENAQEFLRKNGVAHSLPDWLPRKPLLLSYLLRHKLFEDILQIDSARGFGFAWDNFLNRICEREAGLDRSTMEPSTLRSVLERLSEMVRSKSSGTGPITGNDLSDAYTLETGQAAGEAVLAQLQRLPGLTQRDVEQGNRSFVDFDMLGALQGGAFARHALSGFQGTLVAPISELSDKAVAMAAFVLIQNKATPETIIGIADQLHHRAIRERVPEQMIADCVAVAVRMAVDAERATIDFHGLVVEEGSIGTLPLDEIALRNVQFRNCTVHELRFGDVANCQGVSFEGCLIARACGISERRAIPDGILSDDCDVSSFDNMATNNAVLNLDIPPQLKALLTVLRKLYKQAGAGRKVSAFERGITRPEVRKYIGQVLDVLRRHQMIGGLSDVIQPIRRQSGRVERILIAPSLSDDPLVKEILQLH